MNTLAGNSLFCLVKFLIQTAIVIRFDTVEVFFGSEIELAKALSIEIFNRTDKLIPLWRDSYYGHVFS